MAGPLLKDARWVRQSFLVLAEDMDRVDLQNRTHSSVSYKFTDTTPGGNHAINPPPQFTRFADLKSPGRFARNLGGRAGSRGMGRYYSEAIDDHSQVIHMRFGVAQFSPMTQFWSHFYNGQAGQLARTGRASSAFYYLGRAAGFIVSVMSWKILAFHLLGHGARFMLGMNQSSKFYYLKPAMPLYWNAVTTMVNHLAVNRGIIPRVGDKDNASSQFPGAAGNDDTIKQMHALLPDVFKENGGIDVYAMANRAQRLARKHYKRMEEVMNSAGAMTDEELARKIQQINSEPLGDRRPSLNAAPGDTSQTSYLERWFKSSSSQPSDGGDKTPGTEAAITKETANDGFFSFLGAELDDGGAFASFRVNATGPVNESFSSTAGESDIANKVNGMSASARNSKFSLSNGNIDNGIIGTTIQGILGGVKDVVAGAMDQLNISGLATLGGAAFVDIPKHWQSSMAQMPRATYTIQLVSPYGNPISQLINLYVPLAMLLAGALPMSTGRQSYTSPFLLELFDQGRCQSRLAMIDSLQVTRGTGNLGFNTSGHAMGIDITFSVLDMSSIMHMPISEGFTLGTGTKTGAIVGAIGGSVAGPAGTVAGAAGGAVVGAAVDSASAAWSGIFSDDNAFTDYMAVIGGMGLADQIYQWRKLKLNFTKVRANWDSFTSLSRLASFTADTIPGRALSAIYQGTYRDGPDLLRPAQRAGQ